MPRGTYANTTPSIAPWDTPGLPDRAPEERCRWHDGHCAYRDDEPRGCTLCHASHASVKCTCEHGPLTLARTDEIRAQFIGQRLRDFAKAHNMTAAQMGRILTGLYNRTLHDPRATDTEGDAA